MLRMAQETRPNVVFASDMPFAPVLGVPVISPEDLRDDDEFVVSIGDSESRRRVIERFPHVRLGSMFARTAIVGQNVSIGPGAAICDFSMITSSATIGRDFQCLIYSYVAHDCVIGDHVTFGPRVSCNGNVHIGDGAHLAAGVIVRNGLPERPIRIGAGAFIGMGVVVTREVPPGVRLISHQGRVMQLPGSERVPMLGTVR